MNLEVARRRMVEEQIERRGVRDPAVLAAMAEAPRHVFVEEVLRDKAYGDYPLPLGSGQTISQPYIVALMTEQMRLAPEHAVLEVGTGSGYQTYILARLVRRVFTVERIPELARKARSLFDLLGLENVACRIGDGTWGWPEYAPFDRVLVTAAPRRLPRALLEQLGDGGILVGPVGEEDRQVLKRFTRRGNQVHAEEICPCTFVPLVGTAPSLENEGADLSPPSPGPGPAGPA